MFLPCLWKMMPVYAEQYNDQYVQLGSACWCVSTTEKNAMVWGVLHLVTDIYHNKTFIVRVKSTFRRPWRNLKKRLFSPLKRGMTKKYFKRVMCWIQRNRRWLQTFHGPQRTTLPYLYLWLIHMDCVVWIQYDYGDCNCIEQDLPPPPQEKRVWWHKTHGKSSW